MVERVRRVPMSIYEVHPGSWRRKETIEFLTYDELAETALRVKPKMITAGASAYPRVIDFARMAEIAKSVGALLFVDMAHIAGLVAAGVHPSPVPHAGATPFVRSGNLAALAIVTVALGLAGLRAKRRR